jgi:hypothetical protein
MLLKKLQRKRSNQSTFTDKSKNLKKMNKKLVLFGAAAMLSIGSMVAFRGAKTLAEQTAEIASTVTSRLEDLRVEQTAACDARVAAEVSTRVEAARASATPGVAPVAAPSLAGKGTKKPTKTKGGNTGTKVDPLPQPAPPPAPTKDPVKTRGGAVQEGAPGDVKKRGGAIQEGAPTVPGGTTAPKPADVKKRGGAVKVEGGGK